MISVISDKNGKNWGLFVYHEGTERTLYTREVFYEGTAPREKVISSLDGDFRVLVDPKGTLYTYPINRRLK